MGSLIFEKKREKEKNEGGLDQVIFIIKIDLTQIMNTPTTHCSNITRKLLLKYY